MFPKKPEQLTVEVIEAQIQKIKDKENEDGRLMVHCLNSTGLFNDWYWSGMLVKDLYRDKEWHKILLNLKPLYLALHGGWNNTVHVDVWHQGKWCPVWSAKNDFDTFKEEEKRISKYNNFNHSLNTYCYSFHYGFSNAKNKENMRKVRREYNLHCRGNGKEKGTIHPGILTVRKVA